MAVLYISEFTNAVAAIGTSGAQVLPQPRVTDQTVNGFTGAGSTSAAFNAKTNAVLLCSDTDCHFTIGPSGASGATGGSMFLPAKVPWPFAVVPGHVLSVST